MSEGRGFAGSMQGVGHQQASGLLVTQDKQRWRGAAPSPPPQLQGAFLGGAAGPERRMRSARSQSPQEHMQGGTVAGPDQWGGEVVGEIARTCQGEVFETGRRVRGGGQSPAADKRGEPWQAQLKMCSSQRLRGAAAKSPAESLAAAVPRGGGTAAAVAGAQSELFGSRTSRNSSALAPRRVRGGEAPSNALHGAVYQEDIDPRQRPFQGVTHNCKEDQTHPKWWKPSMAPPHDPGFAKKGQWQSGDDNTGTSLRDTPGGYPATEGHLRRQLASPSGQPDARPVVQGKKRVQALEPAAQGSPPARTPQAVAVASGGDAGGAGSNGLMLARDPAYPRGPGPGGGERNAQELPPEARGAAPSGPRDDGYSWRPMLEVMDLQVTDEDGRRVLDDFRQLAESEEKRLAERLLAEREKREEALRRTVPATPKFSSALLNLRQTCQASAKRKDYAKAAQLRNEADRLETEERARHEQIMGEKESVLGAKLAQEEWAAAVKQAKSLYEQLWQRAYEGQIALPS